jgi:hypothetical protein
MFLGGVMTGLVSGIAAVNGDYFSSAVAGLYGTANITKGAEVSNSWTICGAMKSAFNTAANVMPERCRTLRKKFTQMAEKPPAFLEFTIGLPELYPSLASLCVAIEGAGAAAVVGAVFSCVSLTAAAVNSGDPDNPGMAELVRRWPKNWPGRKTVERLADGITISDRVMARGLLSAGGVSHAAMSLWNGHAPIAACYVLAVTGNSLVMVYDVKADNEARLKKISLAKKGNVMSVNALSVQEPG